MSGDENGKKSNVGCTGHRAHDHLYRFSSRHRVASTRVRVSRARRGTPELARRRHDLVRGGEQSVQHIYTQKQTYKTSILRVEHAMLSLIMHA